MNSCIKIQFTHNLRLLNANDPEQMMYAELLKEIGKGTYYREALYYEPNLSVPLVEIPSHPDDDTTRIAFQTFKYYCNDTKGALQWLYPNGFDSYIMKDSCILATTNESVDEWNSIVQNLNDNETNSLYSVDTFDEVDDPKHIIRGMITEDVMNRYSEHGSPPHKLDLKINDICILLRHVDKSRGLTSNKRVRIIHIGQYRVTIETLDNDNPITAVIPRFRFEINLPFGKSFTMTRTQFPLRLAYSISINKSQGQEFRNNILLDIRKSPFSHGHLYVAMSRIKHYNNIKFYVSSENLLDDSIPFTNNVVYSEIINSFN
jgi:hypothetical protein